MQTRIRRSRGHPAKELGRNCKVTDRMESGRSDQQPSRRRIVLTARRVQFLLVGAIALLMVGGAVGGYKFGLSLTYGDLASVREQLQLLQPENQRLKKAIVDQNAKLVELESRFARVQAALLAIMPSENTYNLSPNESLIVAGGHLTIGLIGSPTNQGIVININGKQQLVVSGDIIRVAPDPSTSCQVAVQSFDMFKAVVTASCAAAKPN